MQQHGRERRTKLGAVSQSAEIQRLLQMLKDKIKLLKGMQHVCAERFPCMRYILVRSIQD